MEAWKELGTIDVLVNNAGIIKRIPMADMGTDDFKEVINVDLIAPFIVSKLLRFVSSAPIYKIGSFKFKASFCISSLEIFPDRVVITGGESSADCACPTGTKPKNVTARQKRMNRLLK